MTSFGGGGASGGLTVGAHRNNILAMDGHSQIAQMYDLNTGILNQRQARGFGTHFCRLSKGKFRASAALNLGVGGATTTSLLARLAANIAAFSAAHATDVQFKLGANDVTQIALGNLSFATFEANYLRCLQAYQDAGMRVLMAVDNPRSAAAFITAGCTSGQAANALSIAEEVRRFQRSLQASKPEQLIVSDSFGYWVDRTSADDDPKAAWVPDGTHANDGRGSFWEAFVMWQAMEQSGQQNWALGESNKGYDATFNPLGNRLTGGRLNTAGGTLSGATGSAPTGWTLTKANAHLPVVGSQVAAPNGQNSTVLQLDVSCDGAGAGYASATLSQATAAITPGETLSGRVMATIGNTVNFGGVQLSVTYKDNGGATLFQAIDGAITAHPDIAHTIVCETDPHAVPVGAVSAVFAVDVGALASDAASVASVQLRGPTLHAPAT